MTEQQIQLAQLLEAINEEAKLIREQLLSLSQMKTHALHIIDLADQALGIVTAPIKERADSGKP